MHCILQLKGFEDYTFRKEECCVCAHCHHVPVGPRGIVPVNPRRPVASFWVENVNKVCQLHLMLLFGKYLVNDHNINQNRTVSNFGAKNTRENNLKIIMIIIIIII